MTPFCLMDGYCIVADLSHFKPEEKQRQAIKNSQLWLERRITLVNTLSQGREWPSGLFRLPRFLLSLCDIMIRYSFLPAAS